MKKFLFLGTLLTLGVILFPTPTLALDQRCWEKAKCIEKRSNTMHFQDQRPEDGFVQNGETLKACGKTKTDLNGKPVEVGFCLPVGSTETKISFGGKRKFSDVGDFIRYMYRYSIMAAGIISVLMIILAGFQWSVSGGNSSIIEGAKKRISGALMGLTVAILSYSVLYFVNPNLVNFRLPSIWMINTIEEIGKYCTKESIKEKKLAMFIEDVAHSNPVVDKVRDEKYGQAVFDKESKDAECNKSYFVQDQMGLSCLGISCGYGKGQVCDTTQGQCKPGVIAGKIYNSNPVDQNGDIAGRVFGVWTWTGANHGWIMNGIANIKQGLQLVRICNSDLKESSFNKVAGVSDGDMIYDIRKQEQRYTIPLSNVEGAIQEAKSNCADSGGLKGFMIEAGMHEVTPVGNMTEVHYLGKKNNQAIDLGDSGAIAEVLSKEKVKNFLITEEDLMQGIIIDINANDVYNNEDNAKSLSHYQNTFQ